mmetsp:Transcript_9612/g.37511  ORF Transcript_9612/g.37511 Transcript_9612/m.37511 type:complete len:221 (-) Transcript_9612:997-1659(-)
MRSKSSSSDSVMVRFRAASSTTIDEVPLAVGDDAPSSPDFPSDPPFPFPFPFPPPSSSTRMDRKCRSAPPISGSRGSSMISPFSDDGPSIVTPVDSSLDASGAPRWSSAPHTSTPPRGSMAHSEPHVRNVAATVPNVPETNLSRGLAPRPSKPSSCPNIAVSLISPLSSEGTVLGIPSIGPAMSTYAATCLSVQPLPPPAPPSLTGASTQFRKYLTSWSP